MHKILLFIFLLSSLSSFSQNGDTLKAKPEGFDFKIPHFHFNIIDFKFNPNAKEGDTSSRPIPKVSKDTIDIRPLYKNEREPKSVEEDTLLKKHYHKNGNLAAEIRFFHGKKNGESVYFWENGELKRKVNFKDELKSGKEKHYHEDGQIYEIYLYVRGELMDVTACKTEDFEYEKGSLLEYLESATD